MNILFSSHFPLRPEESTICWVDAACKGLFDSLPTPPSFLTFSFVINPLEKDAIQFARQPGWRVEYVSRVRYMIAKVLAQCIRDLVGLQFHCTVYLFP